MNRTKRHVPALSSAVICSAHRERQLRLDWAMMIALCMTVLAPRALRRKKHELEGRKLGGSGEFRERLIHSACAHRRANVQPGDYTVFPRSIRRMDLRSRPCI